MGLGGATEAQVGPGQVEVDADEGAREGGFESSEMGCLGLEVEQPRLQVGRIYVLEERGVVDGHATKVL